MNKLLVSLILVFNIYAKPFIDGGKTISVHDQKYSDFLKIKLPNGDLCSVTKVAYNKFITAAHCVLYSDLSLRLTPGSIQLSIGLIINVDINQKYPVYQKQLNKLLKKYNMEKDKNQKEMLKKQFRKTSDLVATNDVAIITTNKKKRGRIAPYPKIISKDVVFKSRKKIEVVGYGSLRSKWSGKEKKFLQEGSSTRAKLGVNEWSDCESIRDIQEYSKLSSDVATVLKIQNKVIHTIYNSTETQLSEQAMILEGDSGSGVIEYDINNDIVITGIASQVKVWDKGSGDALLRVTLSDGSIIKKSFNKLPKDWGDSAKKDQNFNEIENFLAAKGLSLSDVKVERLYTKVSTGRFADLMHPNNQELIQRAMKDE